MLEKDFKAYTIGELEEIVGILQDATIDPGVVFVNISCRWYKISDDAGLGFKIRKAIGQRIAILKLDGQYHLRIEDGLHV